MTENAAMMVDCEVDLSYRVGESVFATGLGTKVCEDVEFAQNTPHRWAMISLEEHATETKLGKLQARKLLSC